MDTPILSMDVFLYILTGIIAILTIWVIRLEVKLKRFLKGKDAKTLEDSFIFMKTGVEKQVFVIEIIEVLGR